MENQAVKGIAAFQKQVFREGGGWGVANNFQYKHVAVRDIRRREKGLHYVRIPSLQKSTRVKGYFTSFTELQGWAFEGRECRQLVLAHKQPSADTPVCLSRTLKNNLKTRLLFPDSFDLCMT